MKTLNESYGPPSYPNTPEGAIDLLKNESSLKGVKSALVRKYEGVYLVVDKNKTWAAFVSNEEGDYEVTEDKQEINKLYNKVK